MMITRLVKFAIKKYTLELGLHFAKYSIYGLNKRSAFMIILINLLKQDKNIYVYYTTIWGSYLYKESLNLFLYIFEFLYFYGFYVSQSFKRYDLRRINKLMFICTFNHQLPIENKKNRKIYLKIYNNSFETFSFHS